MYVCVAFVWFLLNSYQWHDVIVVQLGISVLLAVWVVEISSWYFDYVNYNNTGVRHSGPLFIGMLMSLVRRAVSRMLVVSVSLGFGVVHPSLGDNKTRVFAYGGLYFMSGSMLESLVYYGQPNEVGNVFKFMLTLPVVALDAYVCWWIFISLCQLMEHLKEQRQTVKLGLYQRFSGVLVLALLSTLVFAVYQVWYMSTAQVMRSWSQYWLMENGGWQILYIAVLFAMMVIFDNDATLIGYREGDDGSPSPSPNH